MDLFNKKKVKSLERELEIVRQELERKEGELITYKKLNSYEKMNTGLMEENQKLIEWIFNILDTFGTMEVRDRHSIQIPVLKEKYISNYNMDYFGTREKNRITIPEITLIKMG